MSPPPGPTPSTPPGEPGRGRVDPRFKRRWGLAVVLLGAGAVYGAFLEGGPSELDLAVESDDTDLYATADPEDARASPEAGSGSGFDATTFTGAGPEILELRVPVDQPAILNITHSGTAGFVVETVDGQGVNDVVIDTLGNYEGTRPVNLGATHRQLDIRADGTWTIEVLPLASAERAEDGRASGRGDEVVLIDGGGPGWFRHDGEGDLAVEQHGGSVPSADASIIDGSGARDGAITVHDDAEALIITADGAWELRID